MALADSLGGGVIGKYANAMGVMGEMRWNSDDDRLNEYRSLRISPLTYRHIPEEGPSDSSYRVALSGIGQGPVVTNPIRMAVMASVIASGGLRHDPILELGRRPRSRRVLDEDVAEEVRDAMIGVVEGKDGTATAIRMAGVRVAAKTGTAEAPGRRSRDHSLFVCFAPAEDPTVAVAVIGENAGWGSGLGLRVAKRMLHAAQSQGYFDEKPGLLDRLLGAEEVE